MIEDLPGEEWLGLVAYPGYDVSSFGRVRSYRTQGGGATTLSETPRVRKTFVEKLGGYVSLRISVDSKPRNIRVHQLVLTAFVGPCPEGMEGCHFPDRDRTNNWVGNLRWDTKANNSADKKIHGTTRAKLTADDVRMVRKLAAEGAKQKELAKMYGVSQPLISKIIHRKASAYPA